MTASLIGDGIFLVSLAWQVYELSNTPTALSIVGIAITVPQIIFLLLGGVVSDRFDRRRVLQACMAAESLAALALAIGSYTGQIGVQAIFGLVMVVGAARAFQMPAMQALYSSD